MIELFVGALLVLGIAVAVSYTRKKNAQRSTTPYSGPTDTDKNMRLP